MVTVKRRPYDSSLRQQRADETRQQIVAAAARLVAAERPPDVSVPAIAEAAGVGVATVYRHFPSKDEVLDAVYDHWMRGARELLADHSDYDRDEFLSFLPELWRRQAADEGLERAMSAHAPAGRSVRRRRRARRRQVAVDLVADVDAVDAETRAALEAIVLLLTSTTAHRHLREHWAMSTDDAAAAAAWAIRALVTAAAAAD
jgi:AcrR family transcriptional regulator